MHNYLQNAIEGITKCSWKVRNAKIHLRMTTIISILCFISMYFTANIYFICGFWLFGTLYLFLAYCWFKSAKGWAGCLKDWEFIKKNAEVLEGLCRGNAK